MGHPNLRETSLSDLDDRDKLRVDGFVRVTRIERGLRRLLEAELPVRVGARWVRSLPPDVGEKIVDGCLDFLDFGDLKKCIAAKWSYLDCLHGVIARRESLLVRLQELEPIRNNIAHSRDVTVGDLFLVAATYYMLEPVIGRFWHSGADPVESRHPA